MNNVLTVRKTHRKSNWFVFKANGSKARKHGFRKPGDAVAWCQQNLPGTPVQVERPQMAAAKNQPPIMVPIASHGAFPPGVHSFDTPLDGPVEWLLPEENYSEAAD